MYGSFVSLSLMQYMFTTMLWQGYFLALNILLWIINNIKFAHQGRLHDLNFSCFFFPFPLHVLDCLKRAAFPAVLLEDRGLHRGSKKGRRMSGTELESSSDPFSPSQHMNRNTPAETLWYSSSKSEGVF